MSKKAKTTRIKVPKRVAGIKIPKTVRKGPVMEFVNSSAGRMLIAEALTAAIAAFAVKQSGSSPARKLEEGIEGARDRVRDGSARLAYAFGEAMQAFRAALSAPELAGSDDPDAEVAGGGLEESDGERDGNGKKKRRSPGHERASAQI